MLMGGSDEPKHDATRREQNKNPEQLKIVTKPKPFCFGRRHDTRVTQPYPKMAQDLSLPARLLILGRIQPDELLSIVHFWEKEDIETHTCTTRCDTENVSRDPKNTSGQYGPYPYYRNWWRT